MLPSAGVVLKNPLLYGVSFNPKARGLVATADKLTVDLPLAVTPLKSEGASDSLLVGCVREPVEIGTGRNSCRVDAVVGHGRTINYDLEYLVSLTSAHDVSRWTASVFLLQTVL